MSDRGTRPESGQPPPPGGHRPFPPLPADLPAPLVPVVLGAPIHAFGLSLPKGTHVPCYPQSQTVLLRDRPDGPFHLLAGLYAFWRGLPDTETGRACAALLGSAGYPFPWASGPPVPVAERPAGSLLLSLWHANIGDACVQILVNAANEGLWMGGGVAGALRSKGGVELEQEARTHAPSGIGTVVRTGPHKLRALAVYHAVVIDQNQMTRTEMPAVETAFQRCLKMAIEEGAASIAVPALGCGIGGLDPAEVAASYLQIATRFSATTHRPLQILVVQQDADELAAAAKAFTAPADPGEEERLVEDCLRQYEEQLKKVPVKGLSRK